MRLKLRAIRNRLKKYCRATFSCFAALAAGTFCQLPLRAQNPPGQYAQADIAYGAQIYSGQCSRCHGTDGESVAGVNLRAGQFRVPVSSDGDLRTIITNGVAGTAMPPFNFDAGELTEIIAYVRNMNAFDSRGVTLGDAEGGRALFEGKGNCGSCHRLNGKGPRLAPELSDIGGVRSADLLRKTLLDPTAMMQPGNRSIRAVTREGKIVTGRRLNEDSYTVQLIDEREHLVTLEKENLREYAVSKTSAMPSYADTFSAADLADILAYLVTLKGPK
jgi:cytochrome c oxidase cbb3-type subunit III